MTRFSSEIIARVGEAAEQAVLSEMAWPEIGQIALDASGYGGMVEALTKIAVHKTEHSCASAWEEDTRTLVEVQTIAQRALQQLRG